MQRAKAIQGSPSFPFSHGLTFLPLEKEQYKKYGTETEKLVNPATRWSWFSSRRACSLPAACTLVGTQVSTARVTAALSAVPLCPYASLLWPTAIGVFIIYSPPNGLAFMIPSFKKERPSRGTKMRDTVFICCYQVVWQGEKPRCY